MNYKIKDICDVLSSRRIFAREYTISGIPFFRSQEVIECSIRGHTNPTIYISYNRYKELLDSGLPVPKKGDVLMSAIGANRGYPWLVNIDQPFYFKDGNVIWLRNFNGNCLSSYIAYLLSRPECVLSLQRSSEHSAQGALTIDLIRDIEISLPPKELQQHIVNIVRN